MKLVVIGGTGLIGTKLVQNLRDAGHEVLAASRSTGVNTLTGEGLAAALAGAAVVVDVSNAPSWEDRAVMEFFETAGRNIRAAERAAGVGYHVALSVVGTERLQASGYFRAKLAQENLIKAAGIPYTIVRATQFFEFVSGIADSATTGDTVRLPHVLMQPMAADDVAAILADVINSVPLPLNGEGLGEGSLLNTTIDIAGPDPIRMDDLVRQYLASISRSSSVPALDSRPSTLDLTVITDPSATYFGIPVNDQSLVPTGAARLGPTRFADWLAHAVPHG
jgi:uncharacterized protein YbjT (DUF2867 family)